MCATLALDLDGTLLEYRPGFDFNDYHALARLQPRAAIVAHALAWRQAGYQLEVVTGRTEATRATTQRHVDDLLGPGVALRMQLAWRGISALRKHKMHYLRAGGIVAFVGDGFIDWQAAQAVGVPFWWPDEFLQTPVGNLPAEHLR
jgi:phosphoglycolate phosphatase-like HAD superfamily hydrolase